MRIFLLLFCFFGLCAIDAWAGTVRGRIADTSGEALPFATVFVKGTTLGTTANADGDFVLTLPPGTHVVVCQVVGFKPEAQTVTLGESDEFFLSFALSDEGLRINEVVVKAGDDPAVRIMREAIRARPRNREALETYSAQIYVKGVLRNRELNLPDKILGKKIEKKDVAGAESGLDSTGKGVLFLLEEVMHYYTEPPKYERTLIKSVRQSGSPGDLGFTRPLPLILMYENNVQIFEGASPRGFVSPIADGALGFYKYKLLGNFSEGSRIIYKIGVTPRRKYEPLFTGVIYLVDEVWCVHSLDLSVDRSGGLQQLDTLRLVQTYLPVRPEVWTVKTQYIRPAVNFFGFDVTGAFVSVYDSMQVGVDIPDTMFKGRVVAEYEKGSNKRDTSYWTTARPIPLEDDEARDYRMKDSFAVLTRSPAYEDSMRRRGNRLDPSDFLFNGVTQRGPKSRWNLETSSVLGSLSFNSTEGLVAAPRINYYRRIDSSHGARLVLRPRYGFASERFNALATVSVGGRSETFLSRGGSVSLTGGRYVVQYNSAAPVQPLLNTASTLIWGRDYLRLYERWEGTAVYNWRSGTGFALSVGGSWQRRTPLATSTRYTWASGTEIAGATATPTELLAYGMPAHDALLARAQLSYQPGFTYAILPQGKVTYGSEAPVFSVEYRKGIRGVLGSTADWDAWRAGITDDFTMKLAGAVRYNIQAGGFLNRRQVYIPDLTHFRGNQFILANIYLRSFQTMPYYRWSNAARIFGEGHLEWNLQGLISNKIPGLRQAQWNIVLGGNGFYADDATWFGEAFVGIDNLGYKVLRFLRVDGVMGWDAAGERHYGIRVGLDLPGRGIGAESRDASVF